MNTSGFGIIIHGGAGNFSEAKMTNAKRADYRAALDSAITVGYSILDEGGEAIDAVTKTIAILEDSPLFNAGKGSVFNAQGVIEMDASIMNGATLNAGAVAAVQRVKNPILLARKIMEESEHVFLSGEGALNFAKKHHVERRSKEYFETEKRYKKYKRAKKRDKVELDHDEKMGTVGAVAMDRSGNVVAGTSTGGLNFKKYGRIGDSPVIGAGNYADNNSCAVSCTGIGEYFIRTNAAHEVSSLMKYKKLTIREAVRDVLFNQIVPLGGRGGIIAIDSHGEIACEFSTTGMYRAWQSSAGQKEIMIFK